MRTSPTSPNSEQRVSADHLGRRRKSCLKLAPSIGGKFIEKTHGFTALLVIGSERNSSPMLNNSAPLRKSLH